MFLYNKLRGIFERMLICVRQNSRVRFFFVIEFKLYVCVRSWPACALGLCALLACVRSWPVCALDLLALLACVRFFYFAIYISSTNVHLEFCKFCVRYKRAL